MSPGITPRQEEPLFQLAGINRLRSATTQTAVAANGHRKLPVLSSDFESQDTSTSSASIDVIKIPQRIIRATQKAVSLRARLIYKHR
jgi:hypothetical protein